jgi:CelD/BcsL family acetyltransferase involved in cellulose biosynthesis
MTLAAIDKINRECFPADDLEPSAGVELRMHVLHSFEEAEALRPEWDDLVLRSGADIYQTFDWCRIWWKYYGTGRQLHLLCYYANAELVGLIPGFIETLWLGPVRILVAKLLGADFTIQLCNLPVMPDMIPSVIPHAVDHFFQKHRCDLLLLGPLSGKAARLKEIADSARESPDLVAKVMILGESCNTYFAFPDNFDAYLKSIGSKRRSFYNRRLALLSGDYQVECDVSLNKEELNRDFEECCKIHDVRWQAVGKLGHFGDWPFGRAFYRDLAQSFGDKGCLRFYRIKADGKVVSSSLVFVFGDLAYWRISARSSGLEWDKYSLGIIALVQQIKTEIDESHKIAEAGREHYDYKVHYGAHELPLRTLQFMRRGCWISTRVRIFRLLASLLDIIYYKIIFARLAPRIPILRRPLWPVWIRSIW